MAKSKTADEAGTKPAAKQKHDSARDTIESIVVAFIFAFVVRAFEAEAFVIPTGSMAPTLMGRHKEVTCPDSGLHYRVGASSELDPRTGLLVGRIAKATCPNTGYVADVLENPPFRGDRIVAAKFPYDVVEPDRWDVLVFKFPDDPATNYIKRLVGMPGETIEIRQGDAYRIVSDDDGVPGAAEIVRKPEVRRQRALEFLVHDFDKPSETLRAVGWPERWAAVEPSDRQGAVAGWADDAEGWAFDAEAREFRLEEAAGERRWLRYRHFAASAADWAEIERGGGTLVARPSLVRDFCAYNGTIPAGGFGGVDPGVYWVGDLAVEFDVTIDEVADGGSLTLELNEGARRYRCVIDATDGRARLVIDDGGREPLEIAAADTPVRGPGTYRLWFANVDDRLRLAVDGGGWFDFGDGEIDFGDAASYRPFGGLPVQLPTEADLAPVGIAAEGLAATVGRLKVFRDIYYRGEFAFPEDPRLAVAFRRIFDGRRVSETAAPPERLVGLADDPDAYGREYLRTLLSAEFGPDIFRLPLDDDEFLMLGDNSPQSLDGRSWPATRGGAFRSHRHAVKRSALVGKALFILWPHAIPIGNETENGVARGWPIPGLDAFCYHKTLRRDPLGRPAGVAIDRSYQSFGVPFYPNVWRLFRPVR